MTPSPDAAPHRWKFFRTGGFDQVCIETADDLRHLHQLDQKLWAVLTVPTTGLEFDDRTLQLIDHRGQGCVRVPDLLAAVKWTCEVLRDPQILFEPGQSLPLQALNEDHPDGAAVAAAARALLVVLGRADEPVVSLADLDGASALFAPDQFNGDGVVVPGLSAHADVADAIALIVRTQGGVPDCSGEPGVDQAVLDAFVANAQAVRAWQAQGEGAAAALGDAPGPAAMAWGDRTAAAAAAFEAVQAKVEDYFTRCRLAAFDPRAAGALNASDQHLIDLSSGLLAPDGAAIAALPLALVRPETELPLRHGLNPAWSAAITALREQVVQPVLGELDSLSLGQWQTLSDRLRAWRDWFATRPATPVADLDAAVLRDFLSGDMPARITALIQADARSGGAVQHLGLLEKLLRLRRDLLTLVRNFVNLADFYSLKDKAIFQTGTLYLDQRSCDLVMRVRDAGRHAALAPLSGTFLVYCQCTRKDEAPLDIVAAVTGGDVDEMMVAGRNGVFYDRQGRDWHARVTRIVSQPISVRQAFWLPYRRLARMVGEQVRKFALAQDKKIESSSTALVNAAGEKVATADKVDKAGMVGQAAAPAPGAAPAAFDIARFAGIFAAAGLAVGALGTALAAIFSGFLSLPAWKMPLVVLGLMLLVSGPSMLLAWLKLRRRNLGPLLDANGWAVNIRARINLPFGATLTRVAQLPVGASRALSDPYADQGLPWGRWVLTLLGLAVIVVIALRMAGVLR
jgi:hypothetical protein